MDYSIKYAIYLIGLSYAAVLQSLAKTFYFCGQGNVSSVHRNIPRQTTYYHT